MESLSERDIQSLDAAKLYYSGLNQEQVAQRLHVSRPTVSKLLAHAHAQGFIDVRILDPREQDELLVEELQRRYHLIDVVIISPVRTGEVAMRDALGKAGAQLIGSLVRDGDAIGLVPSRTISAIADYLEPRQRRNVEVIQLCRGLSDPAPKPGRPSTLERFAAAFSARYQELNAPTFLGSVPVRTRLTQTPHVRRVLEAGAQARIAIYTVGSTTANQELIEASPLSETEKDTIFTRSVGDICGRFVDSGGRVCLPDLNNRTVGITLPELRRKEQKILVAGGPEKVDVVKAALEHGYVNRLVTDVRTAQHIVGTNVPFKYERYK
ncbi:deoxyribonucleoside regulator [Arcanobacterium phocisimile]|uniref:Deoxyribonucleoside regulator n=1 Tax=Arcanobacterium phocisimile TaxID=1302235 RepID=A0ABX7IGM1_9ACTO|nr:sugar-binding domain-containing protein [Arcanobacterium phocisimile]QRV02102.1 deoxyribonucleoside regulator [Arcanobacterium phocisimile]